MKKLVYLFLTVLITLSVNAQDNMLSPVSADYVLQAEGKTKNEIFTLISKWVALNYNSAINVVQLSDNEGGVIIVKGTNAIVTTNISKALLPNNKLVPNELNVDVNHVLDITIREGRYKIVYTFTTYNFNLDTENVDDELLAEILKPYYDVAYVSKKKEAKMREIATKNASELKLGILNFIKDTNESISKSLDNNTDDGW